MMGAQPSGEAKRSHQPRPLLNVTNRCNAGESWQSGLDPFSRAFGGYAHSSLARRFAATQAALLQQKRCGFSLTLQHSHLSL